MKIHLQIPLLFKTIDISAFFKITAGFAFT